MKKEVREYIDSIENRRKKEDSEILVEIMEKESGFRSYLTGSIIGFGQYHYKYDSGREGDAIATGFSPRKQNIVVYVMPGFSKFEKELEVLGKHKLGKSCLYLNKLADIDLMILGKIVNRSVKFMVKRYNCKNI